MKALKRFSNVIKLTAYSNYRYEKNVVGFEKMLGAVKVIKDQIQYRSQGLLNLARGYFSYQRHTLAGAKVQVLCSDSLSRQFSVSGQRRILVQGTY